LSGQIQSITLPQRQSYALSHKDFGELRLGGWQRLLHPAAIEHNVQKPGRKAGFTDEFADQQPGYRQS
jgi:hypothetical protein